MKLSGKLAVCVTGALILAPALWAQDASPATPALAAADTDPLPGNPYSQVVVRNVFNLNPPDATIPQTEVNPPTKITPQGIQDFFGVVKALFKVAGAAGRPGQQAQDKYYMLAEGQREDDIEVKHIDQKNKIVTFDNHGQTQELPLTAAAATGPSGGPGPAPLPGGAPTGFNPPGGGDNGNGNFQGRGFGRFGRGFNRPGGNGPNNNGSVDGSSNGGSGGDLSLRPVPTRVYQPETSTMTPEETAILIEAQRAKYLNEGNKAANILPPTPITPMVTGEQ